ncbi:MAG: hypothetical protein WA419_07745 [Silvibacterium sp.]
MTVGKGKRPRDPNQLAKWIVEHSTDEPRREPAPSVPADLSAYMAAKAAGSAVSAAQSP